MFEHPLAINQPKPQRLLKKYCLELLLFLLVFTTFSYFYNGAAWNHLSRINTIFAFVEPGTPDYLSFRMNRFIVDPVNGINTGDWARFGGNYYSNKAPGVALIGIPFYFVIYQLETWFRLDPMAELPSLINVYLLHLAVTVLPISIAAVFFYKTVYIHCQAQCDRAIFLTIILFWGTLLFPYSSQMWGHATATAFLIIALYFFLENSGRRLRFSGFFIGLAVLTEYSCIITLGILILSQLIKRKPGKLIPFILGGIIPGVVFFAYHKICFGSMLTIANFFNNPYFLNENAVGKLFEPMTIDALWGLTFSRYRGLFTTMPVLLLIFPALFLFCKSQLQNDVRLKFCTESQLKNGLQLVGERRSFFVGWLCVANILCFFLMNLSFNGWHGGACIGPRYLVPSLPFYVLLLSKLPDSIYLRLISAILFVPTFVHMFLATAITPLIPQNVKEPLLGYYRSLHSLIVDKEIVLQPYTLPIRLQSLDSPLVQKYSAFNLGNLAGLPNIWSLLLWLIIFLTILWQIQMRSKQKDGRSSPL